LRYFNAAGADLNGELGEAHSPETHLLPLVIQTALKQRPSLTIYGTEHPTKDGTVIRDYVHVSDLATAHVSGLEWLQRKETPIALNLGGGKGYSIREIIKAVERQSGSLLPVEVGMKSPADSPILIADMSRAKKILNWQPQYSSLEILIESAWNWHRSRLQEV
jgi:UDP-glucose 4-epimerase